VDVVDPDSVVRLKRRGFAVADLAVGRLDRHHDQLAGSHRAVSGDELAAQSGADWMEAEDHARRGSG
jgi:hypothetical protein